MAKQETQQSGTQPAEDMFGRPTSPRHDEPATRHATREEHRPRKGVEEEREERRPDDGHERSEGEGPRDDRDTHPLRES